MRTPEPPLAAGHRPVATPRRGDEDQGRALAEADHVTLRPLAGAMRTTRPRTPVAGALQVATPRRGDEDARTRRTSPPGRDVATPRRGDEDCRSREPAHREPCCDPSQGR